jgi:PPK2 family polyphosphate:nucleotide phosphotransferase
VDDRFDELIESFRFTGGEIDMASRPTEAPGLYESKREYNQLLRKELERLTNLQRQLFVHGSRALLIILQGMDTSGKDGIIRHVIRAFNPQGCRVYGFGPPSHEEAGHDFLWRTGRYLPGHGQISVFNRSQYEEVLVVKVHPSFLEAQHVDPARIEDGSIWRSRYDALRAHERHLMASGTRVVKVVLHISPKEQAKRLIDRMSDPTKAWKSDASDIEERRYWDDYMSAYSACLSATSTPEAPWYVVPTDDKWTARLLTARILVKTLEEMAPELPGVSESKAAEFAEMRKRLRL